MRKMSIPLSPYPYLDTRADRALSAGCPASTSALVICEAMISHVVECEDKATEGLMNYLPSMHSQTI